MFNAFQYILLCLYVRNYPIDIVGHIQIESLNTVYDHTKLNISMSIVEGWTNSWCSLDNVEGSLIFQAKQ